MGIVIPLTAHRPHTERTTVTHLTVETPPDAALQLRTAPDLHINLAPGEHLALALTHQQAHHLLHDLADHLGHRLIGLHR